jgi:hypothetical protein
MRGSLGEKIAEGAFSDVHAWAPGQVVKLFKSGVPPARGLNFSVARVGVAGRSDSFSVRCGSHVWNGSGSGLAANMHRSFSACALSFRLGVLYLGSNRRSCPEALQWP